jgi:hypothetical protein
MTTTQEHLPETTGTQPKDDMRDGGDIQQWDYPLGLVISYIHTSLYETYSEYDSEAENKQKMHKWFSFFAVFLVHLPSF